jgi:hypothetical protein
MISLIVLNVRAGHKTDNFTLKSIQFHCTDSMTEYVPLMTRKIHYNIMTMHDRHIQQDTLDGRQRARNNQQKRHGR